MKTMSKRRYFDLEHPIRFAHRGSMILYPENTWHAFDAVVGDLDYRYIETDIQITKDGVVVVFHDDTLERCTNGVGRVDEWLWEDLRHLDAAYYFSPDPDTYPLRDRGIGVPRLDETFDRYRDTRFNVDLKVSKSEWAVAEVIKKMGREDEVLVGSFSDRRIERFRRVTKGRVATSAGPRESAAMFAASRIGRSFSRRADAYQLPYDNSQLPYKVPGIGVDQRLVDAVHAADTQLHVWTVNEAQDMVKFLDMGVDGIVTDRPDILNEVMEERARAEG